MLFPIVFLCLGGIVCVFLKSDEDKTIMDRAASFGAGVVFAAVIMAILAGLGNCGGGGDFDGPHRM